MRRRKPKAERKEAAILVRLTDAQKATLVAAADRAGLDLSSWLRSAGLREAESPTDSVARKLLLTTGDS
jgi:uncharacterized protein (DUF1778 family)